MMTEIMREGRGHWAFSQIPFYFMNVNYHVRISVRLRIIKKGN